MIDRRMFLAFLTSAACASHAGKAYSAKPQRPDPATFEPGDLVWPKRPGVFVPYWNAGTTDAPEVKSSAGQIYTREEWEREKAAFLDKARKGEVKATPEMIERIGKLDFEEFVALYYGDSTMAQVQSGNVVYVGHVGILDVRPGGQVTVVEAVMGTGVRTYPYDRWLADRPKDDVWLGRLKGVPAAGRGELVREAARHVGRPYEFFNFDLNDETGFYCSKLVWLATFRSLGFAVDGKPNPQRNIWFSPKQLLNASRVSKVFSPGSYTAR